MRTGLAWTGAVLYPFVTYLTFDKGQQGFDVVLVLASILLTALVAALLRRKPLPALALLLLGGLTATMEMRKVEITYLQILVGACAVGYLAAARPRRTSIVAAVMAFLTQTVTAFAFPTDERGGCVPGAPRRPDGCVPSGWVSNDAQTVAFIAVALIAAWMVGSSARERSAPMLGR